MAITINQAPSKWTPVYNDTVFELTSTNVSEPNFKYKIKLYINGTLKHTSEYYPKPDGNLIYNAKQILIDYIKFEFDADPSQLLEYCSSDEVISYYIKVYENYEGISETLVYTSPEKYAINGVANYQECKNLDTYIENNYIPHSINHTMENAALFMGPNKFGSENVKLSEVYNLRFKECKVATFFTRNSETAYEPNRLYVITRLKEEINGDTTKTLWKNFDISANSNKEYNIGKLDINYSKLNAGGWDSTQTNLGLNNFLDYTQDRYFIVYLARNDSSTVTHRPIAFNLIESDPIKHKDIKTIMYKSRKGGMWYIDAYQKSYENLTTAKQIRSKINYDNYPNSVDYPNENEIIEQVNQSTYILNTDWIKHEGDLEDIKDMIMSPNVYIIDINNVVTPVILENSKYEFQDKKQSNLVQYSFTFKEAFNKNELR